MKNKGRLGSPILFSTLVSNFSKQKTMTNIYFRFRFGFIEAIYIFKAKYSICICIHKSFKPVCLKLVLNDIKLCLYTRKL